MCRTAKVKNQAETEFYHPSGEIFKSFLTDADISIDNSASEHVIRTFCVGKKLDVP